MIWHVSGLPVEPSEHVAEHVAVHVAVDWHAAVQEGTEIESPGGAWTVAVRVVVLPVAGSCAANAGGERLAPVKLDSLNGGEQVPPPEAGSWHSWPPVQAQSWQHVEDSEPWHVPSPQVPNVIAGMLADTVADCGFPFEAYENVAEIVPETEEPGPHACGGATVIGQS